LESHSPEAVRHVEAITAWWAANRLAAPLLFADELRAALRQLQREQATTNDAVSQTKG
jgi:hypothetical protein